MSTDAPSAPFTSVVFPRITRHSAELEREFESARVRGYSAGHAAGMRVAAESAAIVREEQEREREQERIRQERRIGQALVAIDAAAASLAERECALAAASQQELERLAIELAEAILARELRDDTRAALRRVLAHVDPAEVRELRLNPVDAETLRDQAPEGVVLTPDATLAQGDAIAVLAEGRIDARIGAALDRARRALRGDDGGAP
ncbi:FliH/SctL family protein [Microbacterium sediminis]|uniref:FliH/SctL family protein n=1 Tax=Microbacterium sediminis TaxID=904291 RepID=UPI000A03AF51|nr:FliH/SctL family protein [Microbacterium sediminis]QBR73832.1 hypothetical protein E3O41_04940 [Microbacterium sediminis]